MVERRFDIDEAAAAMAVAVVVAEVVIAVMVLVVAGMVTAATAAAVVMIAVDRSFLEFPICGERTVSFTNEAERDVV